MDILKCITLQRSLLLYYGKVVICHSALTQESIYGLPINSEEELNTNVLRQYYTIGDI